MVLIAAHEGRVCAGAFVSRECVLVCLCAFVSVCSRVCVLYVFCLLACLIGSVWVFCFVGWKPSEGGGLV